jgi:hypothetical protein
MKRAEAREVAGELLVALATAEAGLGPECDRDSISKAADSGSDVRRFACRFRDLVGEPLVDSFR